MLVCVCVCVCCAFASAHFFGHEDIQLIKGVFPNQSVTMSVGMFFHCCFFLPGWYCCNELQNKKKTINTQNYQLIWARGKIWRTFSVLRVCMASSWVSFMSCGDDGFACNMSMIQTRLVHTYISHLNHHRNDIPGESSCSWCNVCELLPCTRGVK
ncbi:hypothetical protein BGZ63DRAFT_132136 [Mariannaea sp. PMI_226]|nr:hypothetical protein BGZ63DRAFT_132136 [Mariannaea sp. PMI_226]